MQRWVVIPLMTLVACRQTKFRGGVTAASSLKWNCRSTPRYLVTQRSHQSASLWNAFFFMFFCPLSIVIGLGIVALILDKRDFLSSCGIVWPLLTGLFIVAILYCILMCVVYCVPEKYTKEARNPIIISKVTVSEEGYQQYPIKYVYELDPYLKLSYWFLIFLLSSVVIGSVSYFFTPGYACYYEFKDAVEELMLGYQILVYANIVVFCILGYIFSCFIYRIMINHLFTSTNRSSVWEVVPDSLEGGYIQYLLLRTYIHGAQRHRVLNER